MTFPKALQLASVLIVILAAPDVEAAVVKGVVVLNEWGGPPAAGVEVRAAGVEGTAVTDREGRFLLSLPQLQPGDAVTLELHLEDSEVVNEVELEQNVAEDPDRSQVTLLLCRKGNRREMVVRLFRLKARECVQSQIDRRRHEIEKQGGSGLAELPDLQRVLDQVNAMIPPIAEDLADHLGFPASGKERLAARRCLNGEVDSAIAALEEGGRPSPASEPRDSGGEDTPESARDAARRHRIRGSSTHVSVTLTSLRV